MRIPEQVSKVLDTLKKHGQQAFIVGGCVRDLLMGNTPADYDVVTPASAAEIASYFPKTVPIGEKYGTIVVLIEGLAVEVSTFKGVAPVASTEKGGSTASKVEAPETDWSSLSGLEQDLALRDFTINAMALDPDGGLIDPFGGAVDLRRQVLRSPRDQAEQHIIEDPLRMLRAVRFCSTLGFTISRSVFEAIVKQSDLLQRVAPERVREELNRILTSDRPARGIRLLLETGLLGQFLPEAVAMAGFDQRSKHHDRDVFEHAMAVLEAAPPRLAVRLAALLHDIGKPRTFSIDEKGVGHFYGHHLEGGRMTREILKRLKYDNKTIERVSMLVTEHMSRFSHVRDKTLKRLVSRVGENNLADLFDLQRADILGAAPPYNFSLLNTMREGIDRIISKKQPLQVKDLALNGHDLLALGFPPGPEIGRVLDRLLAAVLENPEGNDRAALLRMAIEYLGQTKENTY
ncbi:MAG: CCA tRNA nucleotidyltransferase [Desulfotomaculaceae bacterium]|nr:CCA tRNA nucleotidyltransferase [Desulfotomaculaceae bacterium]